MYWQNTLSALRAFSISATFFFFFTPSVNLLGQTNGVIFLDSLNNPHGISPQNTRFSSCWGWVSLDGREYALLGTYTGTAIIDLNVSPIQEVAFIPGPQASYCYREMKTYKNYAYIVSEGGSGVQIVDLSPLPNTPILVREFNDTIAGKHIWRSHTVTLADGYLYLNGSANWYPSGVVIFSLHNDPTIPEYVGEYQPSPSNFSANYIHDCFVRNDTMYAAAIYGAGGLYIANLADRTNPQTILKISYSGSGTHHAWTSVDGRYVFTTDEIGSTPSNLKVWDLQNLGPGRPYVPLASYRANPLEKIHNVHGRGYYAYISHYKAGMRVVDVHDPSNPVEVGWYDSYTQPDSITVYNGCWAVYPYFPSGRWIGSDMQTGLHLLNFTGLVPRIRSPLISPANGDTVGTSGSITFVWHVAANNIEDPHFYRLHIFGPGVDTLLHSDDTTFTVPNLPGLQLGEIYRWHVWIADEFTEVSSQDTFQFTFQSTPVNVEESRSRPVIFSLEQNYPNPFNPSTTIRFSIPLNPPFSKGEKGGFVSLKVYNVLGQEVATLVNEELKPGRYEVVLDARNFPTGVYFYRLVAWERQFTRKFVIVK